MSKPSHIAIILDGNRRYAKERKWQVWKGHEVGAKNIENLLEWAYELKIKELTLYCFSIENFNRPKKEKSVLFDLFRKQIKKLADDPRIEKNKIKVRFIGRLGLFPIGLKKQMQDLMEKTRQNNKFIINFALAYGGRAEIVDALKKIIKKNLKKIDEKAITNNLYMSDEPDLVIRTGGEHRVSNFLIWQSYYSEWYFTDKLWPEFTKQDLISAINDFKKRERRFGR